MKANKPTYLGTVSSVSGATVTVELAPQLSSGLLLIGGKVHRTGQVGSFVRIPQGYNNLFGIISKTSETSSVDEEDDSLTTKGRSIRVELVGETVGDIFERGIGQYPSINDEVHIVTDDDLRLIYGGEDAGQVVIGKLSSSDGINVSVDIEKLVTRHSAVLGSTGSGKSTSVSSLLRSIVCDEEDKVVYPSARIILIDIHGEYSSALGDIAKTFSVSPREGEENLYIPYWCISPDSLLDFLCGQISESNRSIFVDKITEERLQFLDANQEKDEIKKIDKNRVVTTTPIPYRLKKIWYDLAYEDTVTWQEKEKTNPSIKSGGDPEKVIPPTFNPPSPGGAAPFKGGENKLKRHLDLFRSRLLDQQYSFLLSPGKWNVGKDNKADSDLGDLLKEWVGHNKPITILDVSGIPSSRLDLLLGALLDIVFEAAIWGRLAKEGMKNRPLLLVLEEAHRYLSSDTAGFSKDMVRRIAKEGRKFGLGAMLVSQRPSEIDETILSQCGTLIALRINNQTDRGKVKSAMSDGLSGIIDSLPVLRTGEAIITGESAKLPMRCRFKLPKEGKYPDSLDPKVASLWASAAQDENYDDLVLAWRNQNPYMFTKKEG